MLILGTELFLHTVKLQVRNKMWNFTISETLKSSPSPSVSKIKHFLTTITFVTHIVSPYLLTAHTYWAFSTIQLMYMAKNEMLPSMVKKLISTNNATNIVLHIMVNRNYFASKT